MSETLHNSQNSDKSSLTTEAGTCPVIQVIVRGPSLDIIKI